MANPFCHGWRGFQARLSWGRAIRRTVDTAAYVICVVLLFWLTILGHLA